MSLSVQQILREHFDDFAKCHSLSADMQWAARQMRDCRTSAMGGHVISCPQGCTHRIAYHSCRHRHCPKCSLAARERWLSGWKERLLDCPHFHTVFTTPHELLPLWRYNKELFATLLFAAASGALQELLADKKYLGTRRVGMLAALHTWAQTLAEHVHLHILVSAGGISDDGVWLEAKKSCLLPRKVLMLVFRGKFRKALLDALERGDLKVPPGSNAARVRGLLNKVGRLDWNVKIQERYDHGVGVATYLASYLKGGPIGNSRLVSLDGGRVYFRCRVTGSEAESGRGRKAVTSLEVAEFLRRLLEHVPPKGFHTVRGYGLYASNQRARLNAARSSLSQPPVANPLPAPPSWQEFCERLGHADTARCPHCGSLLESHSHFRRGRSPPRPSTGLRKRGAA